MNNYQQLYEAVIAGFLKDGFEIYAKSSWMCTMRRWKLINQTEDIKVIETIINIFIDNEDEPTNVSVRFAYYNKE
jgi:hypothetical protein